MPLPGSDDVEHVDVNPVVLSVLYSCNASLLSMSLSGVALPAISCRLSNEIMLTSDALVHNLIAFAEWDRSCRLELSIFAHDQCWPSLQTSLEPELSPMLIG